MKSKLGGDEFAKCQPVVLAHLTLLALVVFLTAGCASKSASLEAKVAEINRLASTGVTEEQARLQVTSLVFQGSQKRMAYFDQHIAEAKTDGEENTNVTLRVKALKATEVELEENLRTFAESVKNGEPFKASYAEIGNALTNSYARASYFSDVLVKLDEARGKGKVTKSEIAKLKPWFEEFHQSELVLQYVLNGFREEKQLAEAGLRRFVPAPQAALQKSSSDGESTFMNIMRFALTAKALQNNNYVGPSRVTYGDTSQTRVIRPNQYNSLTGQAASYSDGQGHYYYRNGTGLRDQNGVEYSPTGNGRYAPSSSRVIRSY